MFALFSQKVDQGLRRWLPFIISVLFILIGVVPWPAPYLGQVSPVMVLITIYYWVVHRPDLFRPSSSFAIGLLYDAVTDLPMGVSGLIFVMVHQLVLTQRRFFVGHSFLMLWFGFALTVLIAMTMEWIMLGLWRWQLAPLLPVFLQILLTIALFPLAGWFLIRVQRGLLAQS